jgi:membrane associated rhomboid family serine protease
MIPLRDNIPSTRRPVVMLLLMAACVLVFLHMLQLPSVRAMERLIDNYSVVPAQFTGHAPVRGDTPLLLRLATNLFMHGGWIHLLGNMLFLWIFGDNVEDAMGHGSFLAFYLLCGAAGNMGHILTNPLSVEPTIGASGAIAGILGAYLMLFPQARVLCLVPLWMFLQFVWVPAMVFLPVWIALQLISGLTSLGMADVGGGVAWWAHVGGFVTGAILARAFVAPWTR